MTEDSMSLSKAARMVKIALWEGYQRLAKNLPDHHVLAVELHRTGDNETLAFFTVVRDHQPVRMVVRGDARGTVKPEDCAPRVRRVPQAHFKAAAGARVAMTEKLAATTEEGWDGTTDGFGWGEPPIKEPTNPSVVALASVLLPSAFNVGEELPIDAEARK